MNKFKTFLKLSTVAYFCGMFTMFMTLVVYSAITDDWMEICHWIRAIVTLPVTPVGLPFFIGAMVGLTVYVDKMSQK